MGTNTEMDSPIVVAAKILAEAIRDHANAVRHAASIDSGVMTGGGGVTCPGCGVSSVIVDTQYGERHECRACDLWGWGGKPLVSKDTHDARKAAHKAFDSLWKNVRGRDQKEVRNEMYHKLADQLGIPEQQAHMKYMDLKTALRVPEAVRAIKLTLDNGEGEIAF